MHHLLEQLMTEYEEGRCDRRQLLVALAALMTTGATHAIAPSPAPQFRGRELNHVTLRVADLGRSKEFYAKLLGLPD